MLINEVQYKVGLTKKSIRYYEREGLLNPKRDTNNDYRIYDEKDIKALKLIKFLRELDVPISDIKKLKMKELSLKDCMRERIKKLEETEKSFLKIKDMCQEIEKEKLEYDTIDITKYSEEMNILNKRGITMKDFKKSNCNKIIGAILSVIPFSLFCILFIILMIYLYKKEDAPIFIALFMIILFGFMLLGVFINLMKRIKEIRGGEENEASKY